MRNWTVAEAIATMKAGKDIEGIKEITTHFPLFALAVERNDLAAIGAMMPEKMTVRRLIQGEATATATVDDVEDDVEDEVEEIERETPAAKKATKKAPTKKAAKVEDDTDAADDDYASMTKDQLIALCLKKGLKVAKHQKPRSYYIEALTAASEDTADDADDDGDDDDAGESRDAYAGKSAKELFNMCKERGIEVQARQASKVYLEALKKADAEAATTEDSDEDEEGWEDEEVEESKATKKASKSAAKEAAKEEEPADEDDEDWDI